MYGRRQQGLGFGPPVTPPIIKQLMIANAVVFVAQYLAPGVLALGAVTPIAVWQGGYLWQPFTYMWLHGSLGHIALNCLALWMFGSQLAMAWGPQRFLRYYLLCGVGAGFIIASWPYLTLIAPSADFSVLRTHTVGASGAIYGVLLAYSLTWPDRTIMLIFPPIAFRAIWLIPALFFMTIFFSPGGNISHIGHLGGVLVGWIYMRRRNQAGNPLSFKQIQYRWRRWRMRQRLRAVRQEDHQQQRKQKDRNKRTFH